jgi:ribosomal protein S18 acetylase RimI-like enzyme
MQTLASGYEIRAARIEELTLLAHIEQSAAIRFLDTPYAFLVDANPLPLEFVQQRFQAGQVWVVVDRQDTVIGYAVTREVDDTLYLQEIDIEPTHGQRGLGSALVDRIRSWAKLAAYGVMSLSTFRDIPWNAPFYSKLGFRILDESELTAGFQQIRRQEYEVGLPISERVIMHCELSPPNTALEPNSQR